MSTYEDYFYKHKSDVFKTKDFKEFCKLHPIFEKFAEYDSTSWLERHYDAVKARPDREIYCARMLLLPKVLKFSDVFSHAEIRAEKTPNPNGDYFCSTYNVSEGLIKDGWQDNKDGTPLKNGDFLHLRVIPTDEVLKAFKDHVGSGIASFEIVQREEEFLIIATSSESSIFRAWMAIVYDMPKHLGE